MKKIKRIFILVVLVSVAFTSCDKADYGDLNKNPYGSYNEDINALLRGAMITYPTLSGRTYLGNPTLYCQYQSQVTYTSEQLYGDFNGSWSSYYVGVLSNLRKIESLNPSHPDGKAVNYHSIATILSAAVFKKITDTYGDIPYFEALKGGKINPTPSYTNQEEVYKDLIVKLKAARDAFDSNERPVLEESDLYFKGNYSQWKKLANTLIMSISIQMSNKYPDASGFAANEFKSVLANGELMTSNSDNLTFEMDAANDVTNPFSSFRSADYRLTKEFTDALNGNTELNPTSNRTKDNRILAYAEKSNLPGQPYGYKVSDGDGATKIAGAFRGSESSITLFNSAFVYLLRAEASAAPLNWTTENTNDLLKKAIEMSYEQYELSGAEAYANARIADISTVAGGAKQVINEEMWVALFPDGYTAWANQRRSGYPMLSPAPDSVNGGVIPKRMKYPKEEVNLNTSNWKQGVSTLVPAEDKNTSKPWFMK